MWVVTLAAGALASASLEQQLRTGAQRRVTVNARGELHEPLIQTRAEETPDDAPVYITLTTTPERLHSDWFKQSLTNLMTLNFDYKVVLNIPRVQKTTGEAYVEKSPTGKDLTVKDTAAEQSADKEMAEQREIPSYIYRWAAQDHRLKIHRCDDSGPLTKLVGSLDNANIPQDALLVVVDDDQIYKPEMIRMLATAHLDHPNDVVTMCTTPLEGFKGFALKKLRAMPMAVMPRPSSCWRVDDAYIQEAAKKLKLETFPVAYPGYHTNRTDCPATAHGRKWCKWSSMCSIDIAGFSTQPEWRSLNEDEQDGTRLKLDKDCRQDFLQASSMGLVSPAPE